MNQSEKQLELLVAKYSSFDADVHPGKMMNSPGLKFKDKVFAFYKNETTGFLLSPNFNPEKMDLIHAKPLSPFKKKPPLKGWFIIEKFDSNTWDTLAETALEFSKTLK